MIDLGDTGHGHIFLEPRKLIDSRAAVCANSGAGKSYAIRKILEGTMRDYPCIILDREGEFATLREAFDLVLVGHGGEVPCSVVTAEKLARRLIEKHVSAVIDLERLPLGDKRKFVRLFLESLMALPRNLWTPTLIAIDEAHVFAPENGRDAESTDAVIALMSQGRKRGFGGLLATQRIAKLNKDALGEANNLLIGRFSQDVDLARASAILGFAGKTGWPLLKRAKRGIFWAEGPAFGHDGVEEFVVGEVLTTHPSPDDRATVRPPAPSKRILAVVGELSELQQEAEAERSELERLRDRVCELESAAIATEVVGPSAEEIEQVRHDAFEAGRAEMLALAQQAIAKTSASLTESRGSIPAAGHSEEDHSTGCTVRCAPPRKVERPSRIAPPRKGSPKLGAGGERRLLGVLAMTEPNTLDATSWGIRALISPDGGTMAKYRGTLKANGWTADDDVGIAITVNGIAALGNDFEPLPTGAALAQAWEKKIGGGGELRMFQAIVKAGRAGITMDALGRESGVTMTGGTFAKYIGNLKKPRLIDKRGDRAYAHPALLGR